MQQPYVTVEACDEYGEASTVGGYSVSTFSNIAADSKAFECPLKTSGQENCYEA